jgi:ADP-ribosylglycohydrolase
LPPAPWRYTSDTETAFAVALTLYEHGHIDPDALVDVLVARYSPSRGRDPVLERLIAELRAGTPWEEVVGPGSSAGAGHGAAARVGPVGAYFADDLDAARRNAILCAQVTHVHPEGMAGAVAVAVAVALAHAVGEGLDLRPEDFLRAIAERTPMSDVRAGIEVAADFPAVTTPQDAAKILGSGSRVSAADTVPFALWCAGHHLHAFGEAFWSAASGLGDRSTGCAVVGSVVALSDRRPGIPDHWLRSLEPWPADVCRLLNLPPDDEPGARHSHAGGGASAL